MRRKFTCNECKNTFAFTFWKWFFAKYVFDIWYFMRCPNCKKRTWMKMEKPK